MSSQFIVLEGPDGAGTSFHSRTLFERLQSEGKAVLLTAEPTDGPIGSSIRSILKNSELEIPANALQLLFTADRAWHIEHVINPALKEGKTVICDRYTLSTLVYGQIQKLDLACLESISSQFPRSDITILTLPPIEVCLDRVSTRHTQDFFEKEETLRAIHDAYAQYAKDHPELRVIDTSGEKQAVSDAIFSTLNF